MDTSEIADSDPCSSYNIQEILKASKTANILFEKRFKQSIIHSRRDSNKLDIDNLL